MEKVDAEFNGYVWDPELTGVKPTSLRQLQAEYKRLDGVETDQCRDRLKDFARKVAVRVLEDEPDNPDRQYLSEELLREAEYTNLLLSFTIPYDSDMEYVWITEVIAEEAKALGLCVFIPILVSFLADGTLVPPQARESWKRDFKEITALREAPVVGFPQRKAKYVEWVKPRMMELAQSFGYSADYGKRGRCFCLNKRLNDFDMSFLYCAYNERNKVSLSARVELRSPLLLSIMRDSGFSDRPDDFHEVTIDYAYHNRRFDFSRLTSEASFNEFKQHVIEDVLTVADAASTIKGLDALINGNDNPKRSSWMQRNSATPYALILAWLYCSPDFERLVTYLQESVRKSFGGGGYPQICSPKWQQLVQHLRDNVKPLI